MAATLGGARITVTGGAGFLGRPVVAALRQRGAEVFVPRSREYDLRTQAGVEGMYRAFPAEIVVHLAAVVGGIGANAASPGRFFYENAVMGIQLIEWARRTGVRKFVALGTVCAYPKFTPVPFRETDLFNGYPEETNSPYGIAKRALLVQLQAYRKQYGFNGVYLLPVNLYGPGDNFDLESSHVIPAMIRKFCQAVDAGDTQVVLWGSGIASREFLYVDDCAEAIALAVERYSDPEPVNIGTGQEIGMRDLAGGIAELAGFQGEMVWDATRPDGQPRRCLDTSRAAARLGFRATTDLRSGLAQTMAWWRGQVAAQRAVGTRSR